MRDMNGGHPKGLIIALIAIIVVLALLVLYAFVVKPSISGYAVTAYNQGYSQGVYDIAQTVATTGYVQIPISENQSMVLVPYQAPSS